VTHGSHTRPVACHTGIACRCLLLLLGLVPCCMQLLLLVVVAGSQVLLVLQLHVPCSCCCTRS
jgi:hypothetical protein